LSNGLCSLATGGGFATRQFYTNRDEVIFNSQRPILVNGIGQISTRRDFQDRALQLELPAISPTERRTKKELMAGLEAVKPRILGGLLDLVALAIRDRDGVDKSKLPRMADFYIVAAAIAPALGWDAAQLFRAYDQNKQDQATSSVRSDALAEALSELAPDGWKGTTSQLLEELNERHRGIQAQAGWPESAGSLGKRLQTLGPTLLDVGVELEVVHGRDGSTVTLRKSTSIFAQSVAS
jgi:hypothetical protein